MGGVERDARSSMGQGEAGGLPRVMPIMLGGPNGANLAGGAVAAGGQAEA